MTLEDRVQELFEEHYDYNLQSTIVFILKHINSEFTVDYDFSEIEDLLEKLKLI